MVWLVIVGGGLATVEKSVAFFFSFCTFTDTQGEECEGEIYAGVDHNLYLFNVRACGKPVYTRRAKAGCVVDGVPGMFLIFTSII